jgi:hypothetical protein
LTRLQQRSRRTPDGTRAMKDRSLALFFRSETEQERALWVDCGRTMAAVNSSVRSGPERRNGDG